MTETSPEEPLFTDVQEAQLVDYMKNHPDKVMEDIRKHREGKAWMRTIDPEFFNSKEGN